ncbi:hypothetical protein [Mucilaginibacter sp. L3T2-6]|uniref:hypothetical protein n=1 Tax=Mucilaginibacter sp. L3T2-6 TaxID=3062491 RepID=UPI002674BFCA|nr:hypothetical protein [Mucilaginibacter sp. L3T2-6]MDO3643606.1 hypothetical protein [Mucilaginibacter sp. L3T2-6]MDV6216146.1 hypothetical protein [Mucilaginibacter sp. L3T2-6]
MKKTYLLYLMALTFFAACKKDNISGNNGNDQRKVDTLQGAITADRTLDGNKNYFLKGQVFVKGNAKLTIPAGVTVFVQKNDAPAEKSVLVITRGAKLFINGTAAKPVVFTSASASPAPGDWGAIVLLGKAPTNTGTGNAMGLTASDDTKYGGSDPADNSGTITYLRLEYTGGINPPAEDEWKVDKVSGLVMASVGSGTKIDNVMVKYSNDDSFQFVGGTVNATHLLSYNCGDDDFDFDLGYQGYLQFLLGYRTHASSQAVRANGFESYNDEVPTSNTPLTRPVVSNMTIIGPQGIDATKTNINMGVYMRKGTRLAIRNSIIAEYSEGAFMTCPRTRPVILADDDAEFRSNLVQSDTAARTFAWDQGAVIAVPDPEMTIFQTNSTNKNTVLNTDADFKLKTMYAADAPDLTLADGSPAASGADFTGADFSNGFFTKIMYRGAFGTSNWAAQSAWVDWK